LIKEFDMKKLVGVISGIFIFVNVNFAQDVNTIKIESEIKKVKPMLFHKIVNTNNIIPTLVCRK